MIGPELIQAAVESGQQGTNAGQAITWTAVAMAFISNIGTWLMILKRRSKEKTEEDPPAKQKLARNPESDNSPWPVIRIQGEMLVKHDTEIKNIVKGMDEGRDENREAHKQIFDAINSLRVGK